MTLSNGKSTIYILKVYDVGNTDENQMELINRKLNVVDNVVVKHFCNTFD